MRRPVVLALCLALGGGCTKAPPRPASETEPAPAAEALAPHVAAPVQLTTSDGSGLELVELKVRGVVQGPLGFTELHLTFDNPEPRVLEGRFQVELPPEAALSRFAMKVEGQWQEGEVVERTVARSIHDTYLHREVDPALLEKQAGNRFSADVFPIPASGRKQLILSYSQVLDGEASYRVPLRGLPAVQRFEATVFVHEPDGSTTRRRVVRHHEVDYAPKQDLVVDNRGMPATIGLRGDAGVAARLVIEGDAALQPIETLTVAFDTSASRARGFSERVRRLDALLGALARREPTLEVRVIAFDQTVETIFSGRASAFGPAQREALLARGALGASDLSRLLSSLTSQAPSRLLVLTDGVATVGDTEAASLQEPLGTLADAGLRRLDVVLDASEGSETLLEPLVQGPLPEDGALVRADRDPDALARTIARRMLEPIRVQVEGADHAWPREIRGAQPGDSVVVFAHGAPGRDVSIRLRGGVDQDVNVPTLDAPGPLISRALAAARIEGLAAERSAESNPYEQEKLKEEIIELSRATRVLSDFTAMLVLESQGEFRRFDIDPRSSVDILEVTDAGLERLPHARSTPTEPPALPRRGFANTKRSPTILDLIQKDSGHFLASPYGNAFEPGTLDENVWGSPTSEGLGLVGAGRGGTTRKRDRIAAIQRSARADIVQVRTGKGLDRDITRRIIRAHLNELRYCYARGSEHVGGLRGYVDLEFDIGAAGRVTASKLGKQRLDHGSTNSCMKRAALRWKFPRPGEPNMASVQARIRFRPGPGESAGPVPPPLPIREWIPPKPPAVRVVEPENLQDVDAELSKPYVGPMLEISEALEEGEFGTALAKATQWRRDAPQDVIALIALGQVYEATGRRTEAARAYGSIIDLFPSDAPMLRHAADRLTGLGSADARRLALQAAEEALVQRPDHPSSHRGYAWALDAMGRHEEAFEVLRKASDRRFLLYEAARAILQDDAAVIGTRWLAAEPEHAKRIHDRMQSIGLQPLEEPVTHFVLSWETDANDIDLHVYDKDGNHASYAARALASGGHLYADAQDGYGPESFTIRGEPTGHPYRIDVDYFSRGAMGHGLGSLQVITSDPTEAPILVPFVLMVPKGRARLLKLER